MSFLWYWPKGGWDFDRWKRHQQWQAIKSEQSGRKDPLPLIEAGATRESWEKQSASWRKVSDELLGTLHDEPDNPLRFEWLGAEYEKRGERPYLLRRLRYSLAREEWGYAWLLTPSAAAGKPRPAVIALHQTTVAGKDEPVGLDVVPGSEYTTYAAELAEHGFVVLAPDAIAFGERQAEHRNAKYHSADEFFAAHADGSVMGKMSYDVSRAVDLLEQLPQADAKRIGCLGHSHGAYGTLFAMLAEPRLRAGVISCGVDLLRDDPSPERWWRRTALIPRLGFYEGAINDTPIDFHHWLAMLAPRPIYVVVAMKDDIFPNTVRMPEVLDQVRQVYGLYGAKEAVKSHIFDGAHQFPQAAREASYDMLKMVLID